MRFLCYNQRIYSHLRRHWPSLLILTLSVGAGTRTHAALLTVPDRPPASVEEVRDFVGVTALGDRQDGPIAEALNQAVCGGTRADETLGVEGDTLGKIADVRNVPGRRGNPLGEILSGVAERIDQGGERNDGYLFPDNARGLTTACLPNMPSTVRRITKWGREIDVPYPQFQDPACKEYGETTEEYMTPGSCQRACGYMNRSEFGYWDCKSQVVRFLGVWVCLDGGPGRTDDVIGLTWRYICGNSWADEPWSRNCLPCRGRSCRCPGPGCRTAANGNLYQSFSRQYVGESRRDRIADAPDDQLATEAPPRQDCRAEEQATARAQAELDRSRAALDQLLAQLTPLRQQHIQKLARIAWLQRQINSALAEVQRTLAEMHRLILLRDNNPDAYKPDEPMTTEERIAEMNALIQAAEARVEDLRQRIRDWEQEKRQLTLEAEDLRRQIAVLLSELLRLEEELEHAQDELDEADRSERDCKSGKAVRLNAACYGFYQEFDARSRITGPRDRRCTIAFPRNPADLHESQRGKGDLFTPVADLPFTPRDAQYDPATDLWDQNLGGAISLLNDRAFQDRAEGDLHRALLELSDVASVTVAPARTPGEPEVKHGLLRALDETAGPSTSAALDTGDARTYTAWWQRLQTNMSSLLAPPRIRLRLPDTGALVPRLPLLGPNAVVRRDSANRSLEVEIRAEEDMLGTVAAFLRSSLLLQLTEEPIPVVVPLGSPAEFRAVRDRWCQWALTRHYRTTGGQGGADCADVAPEPVQKLLAALEEYAVQVEEVRLLRSELPKRIGTILSRQQAVLSTVSAWVTDNLQAYHAFLRNHRDRARLLPLWKQVQAEAARFQDGTNLPWCRNDRFTLPIYSLLDPWLERAAAGSPRRGLGGGSASCRGTVNGLPVVCPPEGDTDLVLDLSTLIVEPGAVTFPVLKPVQVRLTLPLPPQEGDPDPQAIQLPVFPPVPVLEDQDIAELPEVTVRAPLPRIAARPEQMPLAEAYFSLQRARRILLDMNGAYERFWQSLSPPAETITVACPTPQDPDRRCPLSGDELTLRCPDWDGPPCVHTEVDLTERMTRIMARPGVLLREDVASIGFPRLPAERDPPLSTVTCDPTDHACLLLPPERREPKDGWQLLPPRDAQGRTPAIQRIRDRMRLKTVGPDGAYATLPTHDPDDGPDERVAIPYGPPVEHVAPVFTVPDPIRLTPSASPPAP